MVAVFQFQAIILKMKYKLAGFVVCGNVDYHREKLYPSVTMDCELCGDLKTKTNPTVAKNIAVPYNFCEKIKVGTKIKITIETIK